MINIKIRPNPIVLFNIGGVNSEYIIQCPTKEIKSLSKKQKRGKGKSKNRNERWN